MTEVKGRANTSTDLTQVMSALRRALRRRVERVEAVAELTEAQRELVRFVRHNPGTNIRDAAAQLLLASNTVSTLVTTLVSTGWLVREEDREDARAASLRLSPWAEDRVAEWRDRRSAVLEAALSKLDELNRGRIDDGITAIGRLVEILREER